MENTMNTGAELTAAQKQENFKNEISNENKQYADNAVAEATKDLAKADDVAKAKQVADKNAKDIAKLAMDMQEGKNEAEKVDDSTYGQLKSQFEAKGTLKIGDSFTINKDTATFGNGAATGFFDGSTGNTSVDIQGGLVGIAQRSTRISAIFGDIPTDRQVISYNALSKTGVAQMVADGGSPADIDYTVSENTSELKIIKALAHFSEEMLNYHDELASEIAFDLPNAVGIREDVQLLRGDGTGNNLTGLATHYTTLADADWLMRDTIESANQYDAIVAANTQLLSTEYTPNFLILHPVDVARIKLIKNNNGDYIREEINTNGTIDGVPMFMSTAQTVGTFTMGDSNYVRYYVGRQLTYTLSNENNDNFERDVISVKGKKSGALVVTRPGSGINATFASVQGFLETP